MRIYEVNFAHVRYGENWSREKVAVRGFVPAAIKRALSTQNGQARNLRVESVRFLAST